jgi:hypothetical protein
LEGSYLPRLFNLPNSRLQYSNIILILISILFITVTRPRPSSNKARITIPNSTYILEKLSTMSHLGKLTDSARSQVQQTFTDFQQTTIGGYISRATGLTTETATRGKYHSAIPEHTHGRYAGTNYDNNSYDPGSFRLTETYGGAPSSQRYSNPKTSINDSYRQPPIYSAMTYQRIDPQAINTRTSHSHQSGRANYPIGQQASMSTSASTSTSNRAQLTVPPRTYRNHFTSAPPTSDDLFVTGGAVAGAGASAALLADHEDGQEHEHNSTGGHTLGGGSGGGGGGGGSGNISPMYMYQSSPTAPAPAYTTASSDSDAGGERDDTGCCTGDCDCGECCADCGEILPYILCGPCLLLGG